MKYFTADNPPARGTTNAGSPFQKEYKLDLDRNEVVVVGEKNLQDLIDSAENACRLDKILERYTQGDPITGQFPQFDGVVDATKMPRSLSEAFDLVDSVRDIYDSMTTEQQNTFGSFHGFCRAIDSGEVFAPSPDNQTKGEPVKPAEVENNGEQ